MTSFLAANAASAPLQGHRVKMQMNSLLVFLKRFTKTAVHIRR
jgi:hypothetical protein